MRRLLLVATAFLVFSAGPAAAAPLTWTAPVHLDRLQPFGSSSPAFSVSCAGTDLCVALGGSEGFATVSTNPASDSPTWSIPRPLSDNFDGGRAVSCPSASFCAAVDGGGQVRTSANPGADSPVWTATTVPFPAGPIQNGSLRHVSCPTTSFCAVNDDTGYVYASTNPGAASPTWVGTASPVGPGPLTCASSALCVVTNNQDSVRISTNPGAATPVWRAPVDITPGANTLDAISCPTVTFCLAGSTDGLAYRSVNPTDASPVWTEISTTAGYHVRGLSCPTADMCTASGNAGAITSTNPGASTPVWRFRNLGVPLGSVSCGTASFCLVPAFGDARGFVTRDASLPSPSPNWSAIGQIYGMNALSTAACRGESLCLAGDDGGRIFTTTNPTTLAPTWRVTDPLVLGSPIVGVECPATALCVAVAGNQRAAVSHDPAADTPQWVVTTPNPPFVPKDLSCPTVDRCVAIDNTDDVAVLDDVSKIGTVDEAGPVWRSATQVDGATSAWALSCPTATHCAAVDAFGGGPLTTTDVTAADPVWNRATAPLAGVSDVTCPSVDLCLAADFLGNLIWSTNPFAVAPVWNGPVSQVGNPIACSSTTFCVAGRGNFVRTSSEPGTWSAPVSVMSAFGGITSVACAGDRLCLLGNNLGDVAFGVAVPRNTAIPTVTGTAEVGSTLTAAGGTWTGVPTTTTLQWQRCDALGAACAPLDGATGSSYTVSADDAVKTLRVVETASNAGGDAMAASATTALIPLPLIVTPTPTPVTPPGVTAKMTKALLRKALRPRFSFSFTTPVAGTLVVRWYSIKTKKRKKAFLLASGRRKFTKPGTGRIKMKLTRKGKRILRKGKKVRVTAKAKFTPLSGKAVTVSKKLTVKR
jgi:hypothetical protein